MTSPALFVLSLALVCTTCGIATLQGADHDINKQLAISDNTMGNHWTKQHNNKQLQHIPTTKTVDNIYEDNDIQILNFNMHKINFRKFNPRIADGVRGQDENSLEVKRRVKREDEDPRCQSFNLDSGVITHPHAKQSEYYYNNSNCVTVVNASLDTMVIKLTFIDVFHIEYHPQCAYDYLEIRDGLHGYANLIKKVCGEAFPQQMISSGPNMWLKFRSDDTIEYEGFKINVEYIPGTNSQKIPESCYKTFNNLTHGVIEKAGIDPKCTSGSINQPLDVLWTIKTANNTKIYLNFTQYTLHKPNECQENVIQIFGSVLELDSKLAQLCGSVPNSVTTKGNIMHIRFFASKISKEETDFRATFNAFRTLDTTKDGGDACDPEKEFDCEDNTCIDSALKCDDEAHCRLKADEEKSTCDTGTKATFGEIHIMVILIIFSLILSSMTFVFLFKCIKKLYQDHKMIKEHLRQSTEDRLDTIHGSRLTLDPHKLQIDNEPRASLERENHTNEMYKKKRSFSKHKQSSIESDYIQETQIDLEEEPWRREVDSMPIESEDIRSERNGRTRRSDFSKKEESMRSRTKETDDIREKKEIRDVSVGAPDTKESWCQTRESLFQADPPPSSDDSPNYCMAGFEHKIPARLTSIRLDSSKEQLFSILSFSGSGSNSRGFSTFGYSGATIARPSPPAATNTSEIKIELMKQIPPQETKPQKKQDRRPISTETTRSAPDVIIVSKPIR